MICMLLINNRIKIARLLIDKLKLGLGCEVGAHANDLRKLII